jgi:hypothetical protein
MQKCDTLNPKTAGVEMSLYELPTALVRKWFMSGRYGRIGTIGDGSCFFHSVCLAMNRGGYKDLGNKEKKDIAYALRTELSEAFTLEAYNEILKHVLTDTPSPYESIKEMLLKPSTWAEEIMIKWTSKYLKCNIVFLNMSDSNMYCGVHDASTATAVKKCEEPETITIVVAWVNHEHFELIVRLDKVQEEKPVSVRGAFDPTIEKDLVTIRSVMKSYVTKCKV